MNWYHEASRFVPEMKILVMHGPNRKLAFAELSSYDLIITSYTLLRLDRLELSQIDFDYVILDEAQYIKNALASTTKAAKSLRSRRRLALTGTPTENRPLELWSIVDFLMPGYLGSRDFFRANVERPVLEQGVDTAAIELLRSKMRPFILRRIKADVERDLPAKTESTLYVEMTNSQARLYNQVVNEVRPKVFDAVAARGVKGASVSILAALLRLRQVCNHPNSIEALRDLPGYDSGKFNLLREIVPQALESGRKILLFCQFREMLSLIRQFLESEKVNYLYLDGTTQKRHPLIEQFNSDESVRLFLISLKAGGLGLNLTAADTVILYDPWWNPAVERQAVDRAHRIGQTKKVTVYRLVTEGSVEQKIMDLKAKKSQLFEALIGEGGLSKLNLSKGDLELLFTPLPES
jgi:SNF2 family DNA or RNA helicase